MNVELEKIKLITQISKEIVSLDEAMSENEKITRLDLLVDKTTDIEAEVTKAIEHEKLKDILNEALNKLNDTYKTIVIERYYKNKTYEIIAEDKEIDSMEVLNIERKAMRTLRQDKKLIKQARGFSDIVNEYRHTGVECFNRTWTSSTEYAVIKKEEYQEYRESLTTSLLTQIIK